MSTPDLTDDTLLMTLDISSLYTSIPNDLGIQACEEMLEIYRPSLKYPTNVSINELLFMVTEKHLQFQQLTVGSTIMGPV